MSQDAYNYHLEASKSQNQTIMQRRQPGHYQFGITLAHNSRPYNGSEAPEGSREPHHLPSPMSLQFVPSQSSMASLSALPIPIQMPMQTTYSTHPKASTQQVHSTNFTVPLPSSTHLELTSSHSARDSKRSKTPRACDQCRTKKIRCDVIKDSEPPVCARCSKANQECTFILPITETRFKRKRLPNSDKELHGNQADSAASTLPTPTTTPRRSSEPYVRFLGPTSIAWSIHDLKSRSLHAPMKPFPSGVNLQPVGPNVKAVVGIINDSPVRDSNLVQDHLRHDILNRLVTDYFNVVHDYFPIICPAIFHSRPTPTFLLYSMAIATALASSALPSIINSLRSRIDHCFATDDLVSRINLTTIQGLLLLSLHVELHGATSIAYNYSAWIVRTSAAIRMTFSLGWHRESVITSKPETAETKGMQETKRRIFWACVVADRCIAASIGTPRMIDLNDCDTELPSPFDVSGDDPQRRSHDFFVQLVNLSMMLGRVLSLNFGIHGLEHATDDEIIALERDLLSWKDHLPKQLVYDDSEDAALTLKVTTAAMTPDAEYFPHQGLGPSVKDQARILHLFHTAMSLLFYRPLIRRTPAHLSFQPSPQTLVYCRRIASLSIHAIYASPHLPNFIGFMSYCLMICTLVIYRQWLRSRDEEITEVLKKVVAFFDRWEMRQKRKGKQQIHRSSSSSSSVRVKRKDDPYTGNTGEETHEDESTDMTNPSSKFSQGDVGDDDIADGEDADRGVYWIQRRHIGKVIRELIALAGGFEDKTKRLIIDDDMKRDLTDSEKQILEASRENGEVSTINGNSSATQMPIHQQVKQEAYDENEWGEERYLSSSKFDGKRTGYKSIMSDPLAINGNAALHSAALQIGDDLMGGGPGSKVGEMFDGTIGTVLDWQEWDSFFARVRKDKMET